MESNTCEARVFGCAVVVLCALLGAGCASSGVQGQWTDPQFANHSLRGEKVLVVCDTSEAALKQICQERLVARIAASGATPVTAPELDEAGSGSIKDRALAAARNAGAKAVLVSSVAPDATVVNPGPSVGIGIGGFGGGGVGGGVGVSVPVGAGRVTTAYGANMVLTDVDSGRIMWTSKVTARASQDVNAQMDKLAKAGIEAAQSAGVL